jgi:hypothetical protein
MNMRAGACQDGFTDAEERRLTASVDVAVQ